MNTLFNNKVVETLNRLHFLAEDQKKHVEKINDAARFMAISADQGSFLYFISMLIGAKKTVEFGCSFGVSTIYLAAAAKDNDGLVITTEMEAAKWDPAMKNLGDAELMDYVTLFKGNALETLKNVEEPIDLLFLDGAKHLYLPVFNLLADKLSSGSIVFADNTDKEDCKPFTDLVNQNHDRFITSSLFEGRSLLIQVI